MQVKILVEHLHCVRSKLVNETGLTGTYLLRAQTICAGKFFSGTFTLRTRASGEYREHMPDCLLLLPHAHSHLPSPFPKKTGIPSEEISERSQIIAESEEFQFSSEFSSEKY